MVYACHPSAPCWSLQGSRATTSKLLAEQTPPLFSSEGSRLSRLITQPVKPIELQDERCHAVAVVAGDAVSSLETREFLKRADQGCQELGLHGLVFQETENFQQLALSNFAKSPIVLVCRRWQFINQGSSSLFKLAVCSSWSRIQKTHSLRPVSRMAMTRQRCWVSVGSSGELSWAWNLKHG